MRAESEGKHSYYKMKGEPYNIVEQSLATMSSAVICKVEYMPNTG